MSKKLNILNVEFQYSQLNNLNVPDSVSLIFNKRCDLYAGRD